MENGINPEFQNKMPKFIKLTKVSHLDGLVDIYVNPEHIIYVESTKTSSGIVTKLVLTECNNYPHLNVKESLSEIFNLINGK